MGNWSTKPHCRVCYQPHPLVAKGLKGKGKSRNKAGQFPQTECLNQVDFGLSKEDTEHSEFKREMAKLQNAERALAAIPDQEETIEAIRKNIKEVRERANGGEDQSREEQAQALLARKVSKVNNNKDLKHQLQIHSKKLEEYQS
eukprot:13530532-Heterocapsa_arctica.AAC.1